ncbi:MAG: adenylate kinase [bacterium]
MKKQLIFLGAPGSGKGTQASKLAEFLKIPHIDTGSILRSAVGEGTELGNTAKSYMDAGKLVPSEIVIGIIKERLQKSDCENGFILDGFPRNIEQAKGLDVILTEINKEITIVINIDIPEDILVDRMAYRRICKVCGEKYNLKFFPPKNDEKCDKCGNELMQRSDDSRENAVRRIETYKNETEPLIQYYNDRKVLKNIDGNRNIENIFEDIKNIDKKCQKCHCKRSDAS